MSSCSLLQLSGRITSGGQKIVVRLSALAALGFQSLACGSGCDTGASATNTVVYPDGHTDATQSHYESNSFSEPFLVFPPGRRYEFPHGLGRTPTHLGIFLSFKANNSSFSQASGNEALIEQVDANVIRVRNDTCADFYIRVDASAAPPGGT